MDIIGETISHYKVLEKVGEGGMGVVYKARDLKLDRFVALKFLPAHAGMKEETNMRFLQEARSAASLNHPNICTIFGIEEHDGRQFIIMEFVEGQTLQEKKPERTVKQSLEIAIQIAEGLSAAHEKGIIHRDIKPDNIMVRKDGIAQIMDFGLARLRGVTRLTREPGTAGTAGYMSPEQAQGFEVDHRTDIFSLGVVLYELFTGQAPFTGVHDAALAYQIVNVDPAPMSALRPDIDPGIERIVFECLQKDPDERYHSAREVSRELKRIQRSSGRQSVSRTQPVSGPAVPPTVSPEPVKTGALPGSARRLWIVAGLCFLGMLAFGSLYILSPAPEKRIIRASIPAPEKLNFFMYGNEAGPAAISPDGRRLAFVAADSSGRRFLYVRSLDESVPRRLESTEGTLHPFWSPDSRTLGFFDEYKLKRIDASGGAPVTICDVTNARGGAWTPDGTIIFSPGPSLPLFCVPAAGGVPAPLTTLDIARRENSHRWPSMLPDGKHFLYFARTTASGAQDEGDAVFVASIDLKMNKLLVHASSNASYASGYLLYARGTNLVAQRFDEGSLVLKGEPATVAEGISYDESTLHGLFTASQTGVLVYQTGTVQLGSRLLVYDRNGRQTGAIGERAEILLPRLSLDGRKVVCDIYDFHAHNTDLWIFDLVHGFKSRFTFSPSYERYPLWSPGGEHVVFNSNGGGISDIYQKSSNGAGSEEPLLKTSEDKIPLDCSPDGKLLLYQVYAGPKTQSDLWILPLGNSGPDATPKPYPFLQTEFNEYDGRFSPDGRWVAYTADESGRNEVYIRLLSDSAGSGRWQVSIAGGTGPRWRGDGKEMFYISPDNTIMAAEIQLKTSTAEVSDVRRMFEVPLIVHIIYPSYDVAADGNRILVNVQYGSQNQSPLTLVLNWDAALK
jgi:Tol biopolymer transport system component/predicted Ser/Thr protein kinase